MFICPCGSQKAYSVCCELYISGERPAPNPEALMRSRYTAYSQALIPYIKKTMRGKASIGFQEDAAMLWAKKNLWIRLQVLKTLMESPAKGFVEFEAFFIEGGQLKSIHELSEFICEEGIWYYVDGLQKTPSCSPKVIHRNSDCPCNNGRKFKNCHGK